MNGLGLGAHAVVFVHAQRMTVGPACADVASARGGSTGPTAFPCEPCIPRRDPQGPREAMKRRLAVTSTRQPDDPLLHVLAEVDVRLVHLEVDPGEDVDQALHLLSVRLGGQSISSPRNRRQSFRLPMASRSRWAATFLWDPVSRIMACPPGQ